MIVSSLERTLLTPERQFNPEWIFSNLSYVPLKCVFIV